MADNSDIAFQIYSTIQHLQAQQIKKGIISPEDLFDISEKDFIRDLQADIFKLAGKELEEHLIDDVYRNILKRTARITDVREILDGSQVKLPESLIKESISFVVNSRGNLSDINPDNNPKNVVYDAKVIFYLDFLNKHSVAESMMYYNSLSDSEKHEFRIKLSNGLYGNKDVLTFSQFVGTQIENSEFYKMGTENEQQSARKITNEIKKIYTDFLKSIGAKNYQVSENFAKDFMALSMLLQKIVGSNGDSLEQITQNLQKNDAEILKRFGITNVGEFVQQVESSRKKESETNKFEQFEKLDEIINVNKLRIDNSISQIKLFLVTQLGKEIASQINYNDIKNIFLTTIDLDTGEINPILAANAMAIYANEHEFSFDKKNFFEGISEKRNILIEENDITVDDSIRKPLEVPEDTDTFVNTGALDAEQDGEPFEEVDALGMQEALFQAFLEEEQEFLAGLISVDDDPHNRQAVVEDDEIIVFMQTEGVELDASAVNDEKTYDEPRQIEEIVTIHPIAGAKIAASYVCQTAEGYAKRSGITSDRLATLIPLQTVRETQEGQIVEYDELNQGI